MNSVATIVAPAGLAGEGSTTPAPPRRNAAPRRESGPRGTLAGPGIALVSALACLLAGCSAPGGTPPEPTARFASLAGRYAVDRMTVLEVEATGDMISVVPPFWTSKPYFVSEDGTTFLMQLPSPRPDRIVSFGDFDGGAPRSITLSGVDERYDGQAFRRMDTGQQTVAELLRAGKPGEAAAAALDGTVTPPDLADFCLRTLLAYPSQFATTASFLERVAASRPDQARLRSVYGHALVAAGRRGEAEQAFVDALARDPQDSTAVEGLRRLRFSEPPPGQGYRVVLPFSLTEAFAGPTAAEVAEVRAMWADRDLSPRRVEIVTTRKVTLGHGELQARVIRHELGGVAHYGVVFVPAGASVGGVRAVIDARGVNPTYTPRDVTSGTTTLRSLGTAQRDFAFLVPCFRGNTLILDGAEYVAGGDPSDAWDGATDDALAFLNAALEVTPEIAPGKAAIVGYSRGGTVALLAGERDDRIDLVLDVAGPVDQFAAMNDYLGWTRVEILADVLREGAVPIPTEEGGQVLDYFFDRVLDGGETLADVRRRMLGSSPLYFAEDLPRTHGYYGAEDRSVPVVNATLLRARMAEVGRPESEFTIEIFPRRGHDTDPLRVQQAIATSLIGWGSRRAR